MLNVVAAFALQVGCEIDENEGFWTVFNEVVESLPKGRESCDWNIL